MITRNHRFHGRSSLRYVYQRGQTIRGGQLSLRFIHNNRETTYRAAVVVSRKVSKLAVVRNRIRRRIYEIIRLQSAHITRPYDLIFTVYDGAIATMSAAALQELVVGQLQRAGVLELGMLPETGHDIVEDKETK